MRRKLAHSQLGAAALLLALSPVMMAGAAKVDSSTFGAIEARAIGPATTSGRIMAIDAVASNPRIIYVGTASGGVWKSQSGGTTFKPVFDKYTQSIGAIAIDQAHPETVWVGTGESCTRNSSSVGTGLYKTTDGGDNWSLVGLEKSEHISKILIDPKSSDTVYVAVPGHLWDASEDRGLYKTTDGGKTWNKILYINADTGCSDLAMDTQDSSILYATMWQFRRKPYFFTSGGPGSGLYRSRDGGKTWAKLTKGLPEGDLGRIAVAVAPTRPSVVYANVEAKRTGFYRSDDLGETWKELSTSFNVQARPFYFSHLIVDPKDYRRVYKPGFFLAMTTDGGESFNAPFSPEGGNVHSDNHALWIDPNDTQHMLLGTDGGVYVTLDRGNTWNFLFNLPVSQFYHVAYDMQRPYHVYGGLQDNGSWSAPSASPNGIEARDWEPIGGGDGFYAIPDPMDKDTIYLEWQGGNILRRDNKTGEQKDIKPYPPTPGEPKYRFNWNTPVVLSTKESGVLYAGAQYVFRSKNKGESWDRISPDLTTNDPAKQKQEDSGGITIDNSTAENYCTVYTIAPSPLDEKLIWAGTDDGNLQVTRDGGKSWTNVIANVPALPKNTWCTTIEASRFDAGTAYATFDGHWTGDMKTYVFKTTDYGKTWKSIVGDGLNGYAHVVREDLVKPDMLFAGTEFGLFVTLDAGAQWARFTGKIPPVPVYDIAIHPRESDLIVATHGRGIMIIDDITPLRQITPKILDSAAHIFEVRPTEIRIPNYEQDFPGDAQYVGPNPGEVAKITYYLKDRQVVGDIKLEIYDPDGALVKALPATKRRGVNIVNWYMRLKPPKVPPSPELAGGAFFGPMLPEGAYQIKLTKGTETYNGQVKLAAAADSPHSASDRALQQQTVMKLYGMVNRLGYIADHVTSARDQARERAKKLGKGDGMAKALNAFADRLDALHKTVVATREGFLTGEEQLRERLVDLYGNVSGYGGKPTESQLQRMTVLDGELQKADDAHQAILKKDLEALNSQLKTKKLDPIKLLSREEWDKQEGGS